MWYSERIKFKVIVGGRFEPLAIWEMLWCILGSLVSVGARGCLVIDIFPTRLYYEFVLVVPDNKVIFFVLGVKEVFMGVTDSFSEV